MSNLSPLIWTAIFIIITVVGIVGNAIVIWIVVTDRKMRTSTNLYLVNLAIADGLLVTITSPLISYQLIYDDWPFGNVFCRVNELLGWLNGSVSVFSLSMISIDRYKAVMYPLEERSGKIKCFLVICLIWLVSLVITAPHWIHVKTLTLSRADGGIKYRCIQVWAVESEKVLYRVTYLILTYGIPLLCVSFNYCWISVQLWRNKVQWTTNSNSRINGQRNEKQILISMIVVVVVFSICCLPVHAIFIWNSFALNRRIPDSIFVIAFFLGVSNSMCNPIIYCCMSARWRAGFKKVLRCD